MPNFNHGATPDSLNRTTMRGLSHLLGPEQILPHGHMMVHNSPIRNYDMHSEKGQFLRVEGLDKSMLEI